MSKQRKTLSLFLVLCMFVTALTPCVSAEETSKYATREFVVSEFVQSVGRGNLDKSDAVLEMFEDSDKISEEYKDDISRAVVGGILKGYDDRTIKPDEPVKRIEAMIMLARCVPSLEQTDDAIEFTDVPDWATEEISYLTKAGLVKGYGDGTMGANDLITTEQVALLVERSDDALRTVNPGDSFYGYVNEKLFRNAVLENTTTIDPIHGAVITNENSWSYFNDVYNDILAKEEEILEKIVNGEVEYEKGSAEQRVRDMLECIDSDIATNENDAKNVSDMRKAILSAKTLEEFLLVTAEIYKQTGINVAFDIGIDTDKKTGLPYPTFSISATGQGGFLAFRASTDTDKHRKLYAGLISDYLECIDADFTEKDVENAIRLQALSSKDKDLYMEISTYLAFAQIFGIIDEETLVKEVEDMEKRNPELFDAETGEYYGTYYIYQSKDREEADATFEGFDVCEELAGYGFTNLEKIITPTGKTAEAEKNIICEENLEALKINALIKLNEVLSVNLTEEEKTTWDKVGMFPFMVCLSPSFELLEMAFSEKGEEDSDEEAEETFKESAGVEFDEGILSAVNLTQLRTLLPNDIGLVYTTHYFDDQIANDVAEMIRDIGSAYAERFAANTWMEDETKENAIKKLKNMLAVIAYPDNYTFPEITPISEGGSLFSNTLSIKRHAVEEIIRSNEEKEFIRTKMLMPPDEVNACYIPTLNTVNIPAGILKPPFYDPEASYAANLGSIGMVLAHEIGHAFDKSGAQFDENGCLNDWWTEKDAAKFAEIQEDFVEYYNRFEVVDGVVQDANITITENMADFAAFQIVMDILGDDKQAQKECFEAYANMWANLGTVSYLTDSSMLNDVHAANVVRVNAVVASFEQFYEIYDIQEGDPLYVAPEERLKLW